MLKLETVFKSKLQPLGDAKIAWLSQQFAAVVGLPSTAAEDVQHPVHHTDPRQDIPNHPACFSTPDKSPKCLTTRKKKKGYPKKMWTNVLFIASSSHWWPESKCWNSDPFCTPCKAKWNGNLLLAHVGCKCPLTPQVFRQLAWNMRRSTWNWSTSNRSKAP